MKTFIQLFILFVLAIGFNSCSSSRFINRKYTARVFLQHSKTIKHNTISIDTAKRYASLNHTIAPIKPAISLTSNDDKDVICTLANSITRKDSFFLFQKKGRDVRLKKRAEGENILIVINHNKKISKINKIDFKPSGYNDISNKEKLTTNSFFSGSKEGITGVLLFIVALLSLVLLALAGAFTLR